MPPALASFVPADRESVIRGAAWRVRVLLHSHPARHGKIAGSRVPRARLLELAARYKKNHDRFCEQDADEGGDGATSPNVPEGEFEIEQLMCSDADGAVLVKWAGHDRPSWEPASAIPATARDSYAKQGRVKLREYLALLDVAC